MTIAYWCLPVAMFLPLVWAGVAKSGGTDYNNANPRGWLAQQEGRSMRANWAQQNSYEAFPPFAAAVIVAHLTSSPQNIVDALAVAFVVARIAYGVCYITDSPAMRSASWSVGFVATIALFVI